MRPQYDKFCYLLEAHDSQVLTELLHGAKKVWGDAAYAGQGEVIRLMCTRASAVCHLCLGEPVHRQVASAARGLTHRITRGKPFKKAHPRIEQPQSYTSYNDSFNAPPSASDRSDVS